MSGLDELRSLAVAARDLPHGTARILAWDEFQEAADPTAVIELLDRVVAAEAAAERANAAADSMQHFADVAEVCERKSNEYAARIERVRALAEQADQNAAFCRTLHPSSGVLQAIADHETYARSIRVALRDEPPAQEVPC